MKHNVCKKLVVKTTKKNAAKMKKIIPLGRGAETNCSSRKKLNWVKL